jgi:hypothetical protein
VLLTIASTKSFSPEIPHSSISNHRSPKAGGNSKHCYSGLIAMCNQDATGYRRHSRPIYQCDSMGARA